ncbi:hypothetical protein HF1_09650 [Mycoplasma haemofelis str. Langford 1]|uniref:Uncharacterized protein n=1 Tax=Mycoplasma haemofelis (strain Langford 1) TaxID=941640 RepID=E8ZIK2_MYCHL|nr:hypothetical protein [Mycoplasma haemofelis]CBY92973.1 hypothetical protein HF1_09650 [Mycoplasma haemofelis str. Langford 1]
MVVGVIIHSNFSKPLFESENLEEPTFDLELTTEPEETDCIVYTVKRDIYSQRNSYGVKEILDAKGRNWFLASVDQSQKNFIKDVNDACLGKNKNVKSENSFQIYVYQKDNGQWIYARDMQYGWTRVPEVVNKTGRR